MSGLVAQWLLAAVLAGAAVAKLAAPRRAAAGMAVYGAGDEWARWALLVGTVAVELALAIGVAAGSGAAAALAAALMGFLALVLIGAIAAGRAGEPCACFGPGSRVGWTAVARNAALAAAFAALAVLG
ncbi:MAG TPA: MauE/DoxX family redox-associated membrane protein [Solirubrobacterales bacterium]|nr:MauE/DoxX family redox-associated membrane protein [Solirubrobacterales bacterium]